MAPPYFNKKNGCEEHGSKSLWIPVDSLSFSLPVLTTKGTNQLLPLNSLTYRCKFKFLKRGNGKKEIQLGAPSLPRIHHSHGSLQGRQSLPSNSRAFKLFRATTPSSLSSRPHRLAFPTEDISYRHTSRRLNTPAAHTGNTAYRTGGHGRYPSRY